MKTLKEYIVFLLQQAVKTNISEIEFNLRLNGDCVVDDNGAQLIRFTVLRKSKEVLGEQK